MATEDACRDGDCIDRCAAAMVAAVQLFSFQFIWCVEPSLKASSR